MNKTISCPQCQHRFEVDKDEISKSHICPECSNEFMYQRPAKRNRGGNPETKKIYQCANLCDSSRYAGLTSLMCMFVPMMGLFSLVGGGIAVLLGIVGLIKKSLLRTPNKNQIPDSDIVMKKAIAKIEGAITKAFMGIILGIIPVVVIVIRLFLDD